MRRNIQKKRRWLFLALAFIYVFSCKPKTKEEVVVVSSQASASDKNGAFVVAKTSDLPTCDTSINQALAYVEESKEFKTCKDGEWTSLDINSKFVKEADTTDAWRIIWQGNIEKIALVNMVWGDLLDKCPLLPEPSGRGTAFMVGANLLATAGHVVKQIYLLTVDWEGNQDLKDQIVSACSHLIKEQTTSKVILSLPLKKVNLWFPVSKEGKTAVNSEGPAAVAKAVDISLVETDDVALIQTENLDRSGVTLSSRDQADESKAEEKPTGVYLGEPMIILGYSMSTDYAHFVTGHINAFKGNQDTYFQSISQDRFVYEYDAVTGTGSSGGPVFDLNGEVIALHFAGDQTTSDTEFGYGIQIKHLRSLLESQRVWTPVPKTP